MDVQNTTARSPCGYGHYHSVVQTQRPASAGLRNVMLAVFPCIGKSTIEESMVTGMGGMHARMVHIHACMYEGRSARTIVRKKA